MNEYALLVPLGFLSIILGIFIVVAVVIDAFGGFKATFFITTDGVRAVSGRGANAAATAAVLAGALAGKPGVVGAGILAKSEQDVFIRWKDITKIKVNQGRRFILIKREWGYKPVGLSCTAENFQEVIGILRTQAGDKLPQSRRAGSVPEGYPRTEPPGVRSPDAGVHRAEPSNFRNRHKRLLLTAARINPPLSAGKPSAN